MDKISKHVAIIASGGRTGTQFFGEVLAEIIEGSFSVHEPDLLGGQLRQTWERIKVFGLYHMVFGRIAGRTGIRNLSQQYLAGRLSRAQLCEKVHAHRAGYYGAQSADYIIESYYHWFGILEAVPEVIEHYKVIGIVRDPRTWVRSWLNFGGHFDSRDWVTRLGFERLNPAMIGDHRYIGKWANMSPFGRNCWHWNLIYLTIQKFVSQDENAKMYRFEDLFNDSRRTDTIRELLDFMTRFPNHTYRYRLDEAALAKKRNVSDKTGFPHWSEWDPTLARQLDEICGSLMRKFGYGMEPEWRDLVQHD